MARDILYRYPGDPRDWPTGYVVEESGAVSGFGQAARSITEEQINTAVAQAFQIYKVTGPGGVPQTKYNNIVSNVMQRLWGPMSTATDQARVDGAVRALGVYPAKKGSMLPLIGVAVGLYFLTK